MHRSMGEKRGSVVLDAGGKRDRGYGNDEAVLLGSNAALVGLLALVVPAVSECVEVGTNPASFSF